jgi:hypothetical protein
MGSGQNLSQGSPQKLEKMTGQMTKDIQQPMSVILVLTMTITVLPVPLPILVVTNPSGMEKQQQLTIIVIIFMTTTSYETKVNNHNILELLPDNE